MPLVPPATGAEIRRTYQERLRLTREEFSRKSGVPAKTITNITCGQWVSRATAAKVAAALGPDWDADRVFANPESNDKHRPDPDRPPDNRPPSRPSQPPTPTRERTDRQPKKAVA